MRSWALLLSGLLVWAAHFFALYAIASIMPGAALAWLPVVAVTGLALAANLLVLLSVSRFTPPDIFDQWNFAGARLGALISIIAVTWQGLPAVFA